MPTRNGKGVDVCVLFNVELKFITALPDHRQEPGSDIADRRFPGRIGQDRAVVRKLGKDTISEFLLPRNRDSICNVFREAIFLRPEQDHPAKHTRKKGESYDHWLWYGPARTVRG